ncbi:hypothetical protein SAMD00019534_034800, partial [Acytostelium subglobosum LB1]|uniref:hypothetical protein n=1 Tax=Acytostelium subglobosum LB1 TaxID=1410327 RepID=UPI000644F9C7
IWSQSRRYYAKLNNDKLGDRMKNLETSMNTLQIEGNVPFIIRLDGHGFSKFTKQFNKPWDIRVHNAMIQTAQILMKEFTPSLTYTFSDEITLCFVSLPEEEYQKKLTANFNRSQIPFNGKVQKLVSLSAGIASTAFYKAISEQSYDADGKLGDYIKTSMPHFDARIFVLPSNKEVLDNLVWRSVIDCRRNSLSGLAQANFHHKLIMGKDGRA